MQENWNNMQILTEQAGKQGSYKNKKNSQQSQINGPLSPVSFQQQQEMMPFGDACLVKVISPFPLYSLSIHSHLMWLLEAIFSARGPFVQQRIFFKTSLLDMEMEINMTFNKLTC